MDFRTWQTANVRIVQHTWANWEHFQDSERVLVMRGLQRIVPRAALSIYMIGANFNTEALARTSFADITAHITSHNEVYRDDGWSRFDAKLPVARTDDARTHNIADNNNENRGRRRYRNQQNQPGNNTTAPSTSSNPSNQGRDSSNPRNRNPSRQRQQLPRDPQGWCDHHRIQGHTTAQCRFPPNDPNWANNQRYRGRGRGNSLNPGSRQQQPQSTPSTSTNQSSSDGGSYTHRNNGGRGRGRNTQSRGFQNRGYQNRGGRGGRGNFNGRGRGQYTGYTQFTPGQSANIISALAQQAVNQQNGSQQAAPAAPQQQPQAQQGGSGNVNPPAPFGLGIIN